MRSPVRSILYSFALVFVSISFCSAQIDTEFWFAPPEISSGHGDRPIYLRISTLDKAAQIEVVQPAQQNRHLASVTVNANTTQTIDLTNQISNLETISPGVVMSTGIRITSTAPVTVYYEEASQFNAEIFALKGRNALGNKFVIPGQDLYNNGYEYFPAPYCSFDVVATQDNTVIKVKPTHTIFGHYGESTILVKLNAGETYSFRKTSQYAWDNPIGSLVESNKPIAITLKDDSAINGVCRDLLGDQLVPIGVAGNEYVVQKGFLDGGEFLFITATADNTNLFIGASSTPVATLKTGELYRHQIVSQSTYVHASQTIYVMHATGFGCEMGMALLPSITCKGSPQIGFTRSTFEFFGMNILVRKEGIGHFTLNGSTALIIASAFTAVPGTNDKWYTAQLNLTTQVGVGVASLISNSVSSFQVGLINGNATTSCRYGYFSSFSTLFLGDDLQICEGQHTSIDAGPGKELYQWNTGATTQSIDVTAPGQYWVSVVKEDCHLSDTIQVSVTKGIEDLGPDVAICPGEFSKIDGKENFSWKWSDGSHDQFLRTKSPGKYWVTVSDYTGCQASDTIVVSLRDAPHINLGANIQKCPDDDVTLNATFPSATYLWMDGETSPIRNFKRAGMYWCKVSWNGCSAIDTVAVANYPGPLPDTISGSPSVCPFSTGIDYTLKPQPNSSYAWFVKGGSLQNSNGTAVKVDWKSSDTQASVKALITDAHGCKGDTISFPVRVNVQLIVETPFGPDSLCLNNASHVKYSTPLTNGSVYTWHAEGGTIEQGQGGNEVRVNWQVGLNKLFIGETSVTIDTVCQGISPTLNVFVFEDLSSIKLNAASIDTASQNTIVTSWVVEHPERVKNNSLTLYRQRAEESNWTTLSFPLNKISYRDEDRETGSSSYEYYLSIINGCGEQITTPVHKTMLVILAADTATDIITLQWNRYEGWDHGIDRYEIWRKLDDAPGFRRYEILTSDQTEFSAQVGADGFDHQYVIRAIEKNGNGESWSNVVAAEFDHPVYIPNIFTPNEDDANQIFEIKKIELYTHAELTVMDRWGKTVFQAHGYHNDWDGRGIAGGVYFYSLDLKRKNRILKGTISIMR